MLASLSAASLPRLPVCDRTCSILTSSPRSCWSCRYASRNRVACRVASTVGGLRSCVLWLVASYPWPCLWHTCCRPRMWRGRCLLYSAPACTTSPSNTSRKVSTKPCVDNVVFNFDCLWERTHERRVNLVGSPDTATICVTSGVHSYRVLQSLGPSRTTSKLLQPLRSHSQCLARANAWREPTTDVTRDRSLCVPTDTCP